MCLKYLLACVRCCFILERLLVASFGFVFFLMFRGHCTSVFFYREKFICCKRFIFLILLSVFLFWCGLHTICVVVLWSLVVTRVLGVICVLNVGSATVL